jgi:hypothetical protein
MDPILDQVKADLRLTHDKFDQSSLIPMIAQARMDLLIGGVPKGVALSESHFLVTRAIIHYCQINFPTNGDIRQIEFHERAYMSLKHSLALVGENDVFRSDKTLQHRQRSKD